MCEAKCVKLVPLAPLQPAEQMPFARDARLDAHCSDEMLELARGLLSSSKSTLAKAPEVSGWRDLEASFSGGREDSGQADGSGDNEADEVGGAVCTDFDDEDERDRRTSTVTKLAAALPAAPTLRQARELMRVAAARAVHGAP